jgi:hypothetical protein
VILLCSLQGALAIAPILALSLLLGGVLGSEVFFSVVALVHILSLAITVGALISSRSKSSMAAMVATFFFLAAGSVFFAFLLSGSGWGSVSRWNYLNPLFPVFFNLRWDRVEGFFIAILFSQTLAFLLLRRRGQQIAGDWRREQDSFIPVSRAEVTNIHAAIRSHRYLAPSWFQQQPIEWLTLREMAMHSGRWHFLLWSMGVAILIWLAREGGLVLAIIAALSLALWICVASTRTLALMKQWNLFELLLTSPLNAAELTRGHLKALQRAFLWPSIVLLGTTFALLIKLANESPDTSYRIGFYVSAAAVAALLAAPWIGMWFGLVAKTPARAAILTILTVIFVPRLFPFPGDILYFILAFPLARTAVRRQFEKLRINESQQRIVRPLS